MKVRSSYDSDYGVTYYVHSYKKVFEELPPGFDVEYLKKPKSKVQYKMEITQKEKTGHQSKFSR